MNPAAYPQSSVPEMKSIQALLGLLDLEFVKPDAKWLDKVPNLDGSIELTDAKQVPVGKLDVQIKTLPTGELKFQCPCELVAYSTRTSSPFLLICVDAAKQRAFWRLLHEDMPELKRSQGSFVIHFRPEIDEIGPGKPYVQRWQSICEDYQTRVSKHPRLASILQNEIGLHQLERRDRILFQVFSDELNQLLDVDFPTVKREFFADAWKMGVQVQHADENAVRHSIYTIGKGENAPLITHSPKSYKEAEKKTPFGTKTTNVGEMYSMKGYFGDGATSARKFVFGYVQRALNQRRFRICSRNQCIEQISWFIENYGHTMGLQENDDHSINAVVHGLHIFLPAWYSLAFSRTFKAWSVNHKELLAQTGIPHFEAIANSANHACHPTIEEVESFIVNNRLQSSLPLRAYDFSLRALIDAVDYLSASNVDKISAPYKPRSQTGKWVWDLYRFEDIIHNARAAYQGAIDDYPEFIVGNRFGRLRSRLLHEHLALVVAISRRGSEHGHEPMGHEMWVKNADEKLPVFSFIDVTAEPDAFVDNRRSVIVRGLDRKLRHGGEQCLDFLWKPRPAQALLYQWLKEDIENSYSTRLV